MNINALSASSSEITAKVKAPKASEAVEKPEAKPELSLAEGQPDKQLPAGKGELVNEQV